MGTKIHPSVSGTVAQRDTVLLLWAQLAWRRRRAAFGALVALAVLSLALALLLPNLYTSTILIMPPQQNASTSAALMSQLGSIGATSALSGGLSIKNPEKYRYEVIRAIAADVQKLREAFGDTFEVTVKGLDARLRWQRSSVSEVELFLPFSYEVFPVKATKVVPLEK